LYIRPVIEKQTPTMEAPVKLIVQSHLSDAMIEMAFNRELAELRIRFVKYLIASYNMNDEIEPNEVFERFNQK
jgi:hypothetical protein